MSPDTHERLKHFISDKRTSQVVYEFLKSNLEKPNGTFDVQLLAAERLAMMALKSAWKELENLAPIITEKEISYTNPGL